jgi:hypothetical protein
MKTKMTQEDIDRINEMIDEFEPIPIQEILILVDEVTRLRQVLSDIVNPQHNGKDVCSIRCSRCYDPRQIAREALGEDK